MSSLRSAPVKGALQKTQADNGNRDLPSSTGEKAIDDTAFQGTILELLDEGGLVEGDA